MSFQGFPKLVQHTPVPNPLFDSLLMEFDDLKELKVTLRILWLLQQKRGFPRFITLTELLADEVMVKITSANSLNPMESVKEVLSRAIKRGTILSKTIDQHGYREFVYILNTAGSREALDKYIPETCIGDIEPYEIPEVRPNIFALYEDNIGMLNPIIAEQLKEAENTYPQDWIEEAFTEAVSRNVRNWRYISTILERWATEGKNADARTGRYPKKPTRPGSFQR